jgi:hypothetical protein
MWVRLVRLHPNHPAGATVRLGVAEARRLIAFGLAVPVEPPMERAVKAPREKRKK